MIWTEEFFETVLVYRPYSGGGLDRDLFHQALFVVVFSASYVNNRLLMADLNEESISSFLAELNISSPRLRPGEHDEGDGGKRSELFLALTDFRDKRSKCYIKVNFIILNTKSDECKYLLHVIVNGNTAFAASSLGSP